MITEAIVCALACWRISSLLTQEEGPWGIFIRLRLLAGTTIDEYGSEVPNGFWAELLGCLWCASMWVGFGITGLWLLLGDVLVVGVAPFALSAAAIMINSVIANEP